MQSIDIPNASSRSRRNSKKTKGTSEVNTERNSLEMHVDLCELRYKQLDDRMTRIEGKVQELNIDLQDFKEEMRKGFSEVKSMLASAKDEKFKVMLTVAGTVIVSLLGLMGYVVVHLK